MKKNEYNLNLIIPGGMGMGGGMPMGGGKNGGGMGGM
jgi:hypothetical protein